MLADRNDETEPRRRESRRRDSEESPGEPLERSSKRQKLVGSLIACSPSIVEGLTKLTPNSLSLRDSMLIRPPCQQQSCE